MGHLPRKPSAHRGVSSSFRTQNSAGKAEGHPTGLRWPGGQPPPHLHFPDLRHHVGVLEELVHAGLQTVQVPWEQGGVVPEPWGPSSGSRLFGEFSEI